MFENDHEHAFNKGHEHTSGRNSRAYYLGGRQEHGPAKDVSQEILRQAQARARFDASLRFTHTTGGKSPDTTYSVSFTANAQDGVNSRGELTKPTVCTVTAHTLPDSRSATLLVGFGRADCSPSDKFDVAVGRKIALTRAIQSFPKEQRGVIWAAVLNRSV